MPSGGRSARAKWGEEIRSNANGSAQNDYISEGKLFQKPANFLSQTFSKGKHLFKKRGRAKTNHKTKYATVAQLVEQLIRNQQVGGSSPPSSSKRGYRKNGNLFL